MRHRLQILVPVLLFLSFLAAPGTVFDGASEGLLLWFRSVLPALFPFLVAANLLMEGGALSEMASVPGAIFRPLFGVSDAGSFAVLSGFFCGYPVGAFVAAELTLSGKVTREEGEYLLSFCNNTSPGFIVSYIFLRGLQRPDLLVPGMAALFLSPVLCSFLFRRKYGSFRQAAGKKRSPEKAKKEPLSVLLDQSILKSCEAVTKIGGYIVLFGILAALLDALPVSGFFWDYLLLPALEITGGVNMLSTAPLPFAVRFVLVLALTSFGGLCALFQTQCMVKEAGFSMRAYAKEKLVTAMVTSLCALLMLYLLT